MFQIEYLEQVEGKTYRAGIINKMQTRRDFENNIALYIYIPFYDKKT